MTLLGRTGEKRRVREGESEWDGRSRKGTAEEKGIPHPGKSPTGGKIKRTGGISRCREECSSKSEYGKTIKNPTDHLNYGQSHQKLRRLGGGWAPRPRLQRLVPGLGGGAERKLLGRSLNHLKGQRLPGRLENKAVAEEGSNTLGAGKWKAASEGTWEKSLVCARAGEGREEGVGPHRIPPTPQQAYRPAS